VEQNNRYGHEEWICPDTGNIYTGEWLGENKEGFGV
jgi:hypothetical protein